MTPAATDYLIQYGRPAFVGRFAAPPGPVFGRGDQVVVRSPRGLELGTVLCEPADRFARALGPTDGDIVRPAGLDDIGRSDALAERGLALLAAAERRAVDSPATFLDAEVFLDGTAVLHAVVWADADLTPLIDSVSDELGMTVRLHDAGRTPVAKDAASHGCGKPGCGSESGGGSSCGTGGGCSTGSCSRGSVKSADDLTAYFTDLRQKMDDHFGRSRTPLN